MHKKYKTERDGFLVFVFIYLTNFLLLKFYDLGLTTEFKSFMFVFSPITFPVHLLMIIGDFTMESVKWCERLF